MLLLLLLLNALWRKAAVATPNSAAIFNWNTHSRTRRKSNTLLAARKHIPWCLSHTGELPSLFCSQQHLPKTSILHGLVVSAFRERRQSHSRFASFRERIETRSCPASKGMALGRGHAVRTTGMWVGYGLMGFAAVMLLFNAMFPSPTEPARAPRRLQSQAGAKDASGEIRWQSTRDNVPVVVTACPLDEAELALTLSSILRANPAGAAPVIHVISNDPEAAHTIAYRAQQQTDVEVTVFPSPISSWAAFMGDLVHGLNSSAAGSADAVALLPAGSTVHPDGFFPWLHETRRLLQADATLVGASLASFAHRAGDIELPSMYPFAHTTCQARGGLVASISRWQQLAAAAAVRASGQVGMQQLDLAAQSLCSVENLLALFPPAGQACILDSHAGALSADAESTRRTGARFALPCAQWVNRIRQLRVNDLNVVDEGERVWTPAAREVCGAEMTPRVRPSGLECCPVGATRDCTARPKTPLRIMLHHACELPAGLLVHTLKHLASETVERQTADLDVVLVRGDAADCTIALQSLERWRWAHGYIRINQTDDRRITGDPAGSLGALWPAGPDDVESSQIDLFVMSGLEVSPLATNWIRSTLQRYSRTLPVGGATLLPTRHQVRVEQAELRPVISAIPPLDGVALSSSSRAQFTRWLGQSLSRSTLYDYRLNPEDGLSLTAAFRRCVALFWQQQHQFAVQPSGALLARRYTDEQQVAAPLASAAHTVELPDVPSAVDANGDPIALCLHGPCPSHATCQDTLNGAMCVCPVNAADYETCVRQLESPSGSDRPVLLTDEQAMHNLLQHVSENNAVTVMTVTSGFVDFATNLLMSMTRVGVNNFIIIAEDYTSYQRLNARYPHRVVLPNLRTMMQGMSGRSGADVADRTGFSYASKQYNEIVGRRPRYLLGILRMGFDVLYTDTDTVWLENPYHQFQAGYDMQISSDKEDETFDPWHMLCTGFMFLRSKRPVMAFLDEWRRALEAAQGVTVNQYVFNDIFNRKYREQIPTRPLPDRKFPSGALYFDKYWRSAQPEQPTVVHNNFIVGADAKRQRFQKLGLWYVGQSKNVNGV
ncbi:uncharacterized protein MONBRDRAFT_24568 [Monosiga brevicollis MX1]|uniref:EGF-like domain-containing protein n=1 Tax=Monosiga brevicollis TaxID=81824 RepID=A9UWU3_MONBE|nr:uncharacterized protein MONBRDRAFT_24568 [Monosiga brevicollis MX1]EDQ90101.1 predicted protein [Monosiga brevicollis MX1]|eukprot:XP_001744868.1 hypothetical protein [Monosiga brevicollis MX1]